MTGRTSAPKNWGRACVRACVLTCVCARVMLLHRCYVTFGHFQWATEDGKKNMIFIFINLIQFNERSLCACAVV